MIEDVLNKFMKLDEEVMSSRIKLKGWDLWPLIRYPISEFILSEKKLSVVDHKTNIDYKKKNIYIYFFKAFQLIRNLFSLKNIFGKTDIILINNSSKILRFEKNDETLITWAIKKSLPNKFNLLIIDTTSIYKNKSKNIIYISSILKISKILSKIFFHKNSFSKKITPIMERIRKYFHVDLNWSIDKLYQILLHQIVFAFIVRIIISFKKPKIIIYDDNGYMRSINKIAHKNNILTIDYQHALLSEFSVIYKHHLNCPYKDYRPDYFMSWGSFKIDTYKNLYKCLIVGNPLFEKMFEENKHIKKNDNILSIISDGHLTRENLSSLAISLAREFPDFIIYYKLRFEEYANFRNLYSEDLLYLKNVFFVNNDKNSLYYYLKKSNYVIGTNSTVLVESIPLTNVIVYKKGWSLEMKSFIESKFVLSSESINEIISIIRNKKKPEKIDNDIFFTKNSIVNMRYEIEKLLN